MDKYLCCGSDRVTDAAFCQACIEVELDKLLEWAKGEPQRLELAVAALGPWGRVRYWFGSWMACSAIAYYGVERCRWWHGGQTLAERAWMLLVPAVFASERVSTLVERFGRPV